MKILSVLLLTISGIYFLFKLKFNNLKIISMIKSIFSKEKGISRYSSLCVSLSSKIGVGSISGTAIAIYYGGPGSIFWMWIITILTSSNTFAETILSLKYRIKNKNNYEGGPFYYIKSFSKELAFIYCVIFILSYILGFIPIQVNTITSVIREVVDIPSIIIGIMLIIMIFFIIIGGINEISNIVSKILPILIFTYIITCILIIRNNNIIDIFLLIVKDAFSSKSFLTGLVIGCTKSIFSTESGLGTSGVASSCTTNNDYLKNGLCQTLGVYIDTFLITTLTAFVIIISSNSKVYQNINGIEIAFDSFGYSLGINGKLILFISIILFAFSTLLGGYYYIEVGLKYLFNKNSKLYILLFLIVILVSSIISPNYIWNIIDIFVILLSFINIISLLILRKDVKL